MARALPSLLVVALLGATAAAFAVTEGLKLEHSPIIRTQVGIVVPAHPRILGPPLFSPVCRCATDHVSIWFFLRRADRVTVTIRSGSHDVVDTLAHDRPYRRGWVRLRWDGIQPSGIVAADGAYTPYVHLAREHRTIGLPNPIQVDTSPPKTVGVALPRRLISPDGDGRGDRVTIRYKLDAPARAILYVDDTRAVVNRAAADGTIRFYGKVGGRVLRPGPHVLEFAAQDAAGNVSPRQRIGTLTVRYVTLGRRLVSIGPRERFFIRVSADAKTVGYRFAGRTGHARPGTLVLRAPKRLGVYRLYVWVGSHADVAKVRVERA